MKILVQNFVVLIIYVIDVFIDLPRILHLKNLNIHKYQ